MSGGGKTIATLFSGCGGVECGAMAAGLTPLWAVEMDPQIADVYRANTGPHVITADATTVDYEALEIPYWLHMSPVCTNASRAKTDGGESELDIALAQACARAIARKPPIVSLENVWGYRTFESFRIILRALRENAYALDFWHLNSADYGVPQTRRRLILVARRDRQPVKPPPTHAERADVGQMAWLDPLPAWAGWYEAIEDLLPTLPESKFAPWQLERLQHGFITDGHWLQMTGATSAREETRGNGVLACHRPAITVATNSNAARAFILSNAATERSDGVRTAAEPMLSVTRQYGAGVRAFLVHPTEMRNETIRHEEDPAFTVVGFHGSPRAFILSNAATERSDGVRTAAEPMLGVTGQHGARVRAFLVRDDNAREEWGKQCRRADEPAFTQSQSSGGRAWLAHGRVVAMNARALARFQSFPDWYQWPARASLAAKCIGNAVPPLLMRRIVEAHW